MFKLSEEIRDAGSIGISGHIRPDGDCVGACISLYLYLKKIIKSDVKLKLYLQKPADIFSELKGYQNISDPQAAVKGMDVFFALDSDRDRLCARDAFIESTKRINIDHHISNPGCGNVNYIVPEASSASELVYNLIEADGGAEIMDEDIAKAIYTGIIHDTGVFQYSNTSPETLRIAAELIKFGFDFSRLIDSTFYEKSYLQNQLMGRALLESILFMDGKCIVSGLDRKLLRFYGADSSDLSGIVSQLRLTKGVECAIFMYELDTHEYKVSMRSSEKVDVAKVASYFGGGGHKKAAGCTMKGTFHDIVNNLSLHIAEQLRK